MPRHLRQPPKEEREITTGKTMHRARLYDLLGAISMLGRGRAMRERTIALAHLVPGERVLEVGCGTGEIALRAKARIGPTGSVAGIDPSPEMIAVARQKAARANLDIDYRVAGVEALPFADATFDVVLSSLMMHHLPEALKPRALAEIRRVLKPGGHLLVVDFTEPTSRLGRLEPIWLIHRQLPSDVRDLPGLLEAAGFAAVEAGPTGFGYLGYVHGRASQ
jgi:demethylmenaquinone methyltransferase/2-methoxy-6-polyprenyl-1,4-benzoquinol methylase/phosphoethanolamine N-methyltransferase